MRRPLILVAAAVVLAGCGTTTSAGNFSGEQSTVAKVIDTLSSDGTSHNASGICNDVFAPSIAARLKAQGETCDSVVGDELDSVDIFALTVQAVKITGTTAQVTVKTTSNGKNEVEKLDLVHEPDGSWRLSSFA